MTLLTICEAALEENGEYAVPSSIISNTDPTAVLLLALANRSGKHLTRMYKWQVLLTTYTFATVASTADYALPSAFQRFADRTVWDRTNDSPLRGPVSASVWEATQSGGAGMVDAWSYFRVAGSLFSIAPTPSDARTIAYQYYSKNWLTGKSAYTDDADAPLLDETLLTMDLRWRFLHAKGVDHTEEKAEFEEFRDMMIAQEGGRDVIRMGGGAVYAGNLPESGFGS